MPTKYQIRMAKISAAKFSKASKRFYGKYSTKEDYLYNVAAALRGSFSRR